MDWILSNKYLKNCQGKIKFHCGQIELLGNNYMPDTVRSQHHTHLMHVFPEFSRLRGKMLYTTGRLESQ